MPPLLFCRRITLSRVLQDGNYTPTSIVSSNGVNVVRKNLETTTFLIALKGHKKKSSKKLLFAKRLLLRWACPFQTTRTMKMVLQQNRHMKIRRKSRKTQMMKIRNNQDMSLNFNQLGIQFRFWELATFSTTSLRYFLSSFTYFWDFLCFAL